MTSPPRRAVTFSTRSGSVPRNWHTAHRDHLSLGQRAADGLRDGMGSWTFIAVSLTLMAVWMVLNGLDAAWDPYPYILLNLVLSMTAALQGAILLIAAKRQDAISAALAQHDYETDVAAREDIEHLMRVNEEQLELLKVMHAALISPGADHDRGIDEERSGR